MFANLAKAHGALWSTDRRYSLCWLLWPQALAFLLVGWLWFGASSNLSGAWIPWARPATAPNAGSQSQSPDPSASRQVAPFPIPIPISPGAPTVADGAGRRAYAEAQTMVNASYSKYFPAGGANIPLPDGEWQLYAISKINQDNLLGMAYFIVRIERAHIEGAIRIFVADNTSRPPSGIAAPPRCQDHFVDNIFTFNEACNDFGSQSYWRVFNYFAGSWKNVADPKAHISDLDRAAGRAIFGRGLSYSQDFLGVQFNRAEKSGFIQADYLFSTPSSIVSDSAETFRGSDWHASNIQKFPEKLAFAKKLKVWGAQFWPDFKAAFTAWR
jgi:hypothetical protein